MHIQDGILSEPVLIAGAVTTIIGTAYGLRKLDYEQVPRAALLGSGFFIASLIHIPIGVSSIHLILTGLIGLIMGYAAFPVILVGLILQKFIFSHGGVTTIGINTLNMALPAVLCYCIFHRIIKRTSRQSIVFICGFLLACISITLSTVMLSLSLYISRKELFETSLLLIVGNLPLIIIEGVITGSIAVFLKKVRPEIFDK